MPITSTNPMMLSILSLVTALTARYPFVDATRSPS
jgi:hypothetical protein